VFSQYHYLSHSHNDAARQFVATINDRLVGFISYLHFPHAQIKNMKRVHRLVILPDYQGIGIGMTLLNETAKLFKDARIRLVTSNLAMAKGLEKDSAWALKRQSHVAVGAGQIHNKAKGMLGSARRLTTAWEYKQEKKSLTM